MELIHSSSRMFYIANICWCLMTRGMPGNILLPSLPHNMIQPLPLAVTNPPPLTMVFIAAAKYFPAMREIERTRGHDNKNLCEHFHEKRECYVENMSRHVSLCWLLWDKLQGETDITGLWTLIICSQVSRPDYLIIFSPIYITINPRDTQTVGGGPSPAYKQRKTWEIFPKY